MNRLPKELVAIDLKSFKYSELISATKNFGNDNLLSKKSYGKVYKGWIDRTTYSPSEDNTRLPVAIKRLDNYKCTDRVMHLVLYPFYLNLAIINLKTRIYSHSNTTQMVALHIFFSCMESTLL